MILSSMPGVGRFTATSLACRVGRIERFPRAHSLANYWGLTPGCRNSGENDQRLGRITKAGSSTARWLLANWCTKCFEGTAGYGSDSKHQTPTGILHRSRGGDAQAGHHHLAHAEQRKDVCGVPRTRGCMSEDRREERRPRRDSWGCAPDPGI
jgi:hypothetical protein